MYCARLKNVHDLALVTARMLFLLNIGGRIYRIKSVGRVIYALFLLLMLSCCEA